MCGLVALGTPGACAGSSVAWRVPTGIVVEIRIHGMFSMGQSADLCGRAETRLVAKFRRELRRRFLLIGVLKGNVQDCYR
jgi:hypothetical protein